MSAFNNPELIARCRATGSVYDAVVHYLDTIVVSMPYHTLNETVDLLGYPSEDMRNHFLYIQSNRSNDLNENPYLVHRDPNLSKIWMGQSLLFSDLVVLNDKEKYSHICQFFRDNARDVMIFHSYNAAFKVQSFSHYRVSEIAFSTEELQLQFRLLSGSLHE